ncbi:hypothetical protein BC831DRAFT_464058 [Entophlyctis helioformis]|nr:hypothetical protein BC831DRAFT_464058 [Entophlyctis helioformis]
MLVSDNHASQDEGRDGRDGSKACDDEYDPSEPLMDAAVLLGALKAARQSGGAAHPPLSPPVDAAVPAAGHEQGQPAEAGLAGAGAGAEYEAEYEEEDTQEGAHVLPLLASPAADSNSANDSLSAKANAAVAAVAVDAADAVVAFDSASGATVHEADEYEPENPALAVAAPHAAASSGPIPHHDDSCSESTVSSADATTASVPAVAPAGSDAHGNVAGAAAEDGRADDEMPAFYIDPTPAAISPSPSSVAVSEPPLSGPCPSRDSSNGGPTPSLTAAQDRLTKRQRHEQQRHSENPADPHMFHATHTVYYTPPENALLHVPPKCRLFMGQLPAEHISKQEVAQIFAKYGNILEISLKGSFGFVQFDNPASCQMAIQCEDRRKLGDKTLDIKLSREPTQRRDADVRQPDTDRGSDRGMPGVTGANRDAARGRLDRNERGGRQAAGPTRGGIDRFSDRGAKPYDRRDSGVQDFQAERRGSFGSMASREYHDDRRGGNSRDHRDNRRAPQAEHFGRGNRSDREGYGGRGGRRSRSPPPFSSRGASHRDAIIASMADVPRRFGKSVPDCEIVILGDVDRGFASFVETSLGRARISCDIIRVSPHIDLKQLVDQLKSDGVRGIVFLEQSRERSAKVALQVFNAFGVVSEYDNIPIDHACGLIEREKTAAAQALPTQPYYGAGVNPPQPVAPMPQMPLLPQGPQMHMLPGMMQPFHQQPVQQQQQQQQHQQQQQQVPMASIGSNPQLANAFAALVGQAQAQGKAIDPQALMALVGNVAPTQPLPGLGMPPAGAFSQMPPPQQQHQQMPLQPPQQAFMPQFGLQQLPQFQQMHQSLPQQPPLQMPPYAQQTPSPLSGGANIANMLNQLSASTKLLQAISSIKHTNDRS